MNNQFSIIVALDENNGIGKAGVLPWHLPEDLKHFKDITCQTSSKSKKNAVIMGRKTWESIPEKFRPLPGRINAVLSRDENYRLPKEVLKFSSLEASLEFFNKRSEFIENIFVIGGEQVFNQAINHPLCKMLYLTHIKGSYSCDTFFPEFKSKFSPEAKTQDFLFSNGMYYRFCSYQKKSNS